MKRATAVWSFVACLGVGVLTPGHPYAAQEPGLAAPIPSGATWFCPMHPDVTAPVSGQCPICKMRLVVGDPLDTREYELDFATSPSAVGAGTPFKIMLRVRHPGTGEVVQSFEEVHDKRYHLFIISRDMSVFEHVHPDQRPDGRWEFAARLPKPGYYTIVSDFLPTGGSPQFITRPLITADFKGDIEASKPTFEADRAFEKNVDGMTARLEFDPQPLQPGEHGHLMFTLTDTVTGRPVTDLQPYLGAFGHTLIMSEDQANVVHSHPTPDLANDVSKGGGGPRVMFESYLPLPGQYRAWTQFLRNDRLTTFSFTFRVPSFEEAMRR